MNLTWYWLVFIFLFFWSLTKIQTIKYDFSFIVPSWWEKTEKNYLNLIFYYFIYNLSLHLISSYVLLLRRRIHDGWCSTATCPYKWYCMSVCVCVCVSIKAYVQRFPLDFITLGNVNIKGEIFISIFICEHM